MKSFAAALAAAVLLLGPVSARADKSQCLLGRLCLWQHADFEGGFIQYLGNDSNYGNNNFDNGVALGDHASSVCNATGRTAFLYEHDSHGGHGFFLAPSGPLACFADLDILGFDDQLSSHFLF